MLRADLDPSADAQLIVIAYWLALGALPVAIGIAVLRHRLYDIDVLISRTFVYGSLLALAAGVYSASIRLFQYFFVLATGNKSDFAFVISTLILGAAFLPARKREEPLQDRLVVHLVFRATDQNKVPPLLLPCHRDQQSVRVLQPSPFVRCAQFFRVIPAAVRRPAR